MPDKETPPHRRWRKGIAKLQVAGERLETIAEQYLQIPFEVRPGWSPPALDWSAHHDSLDTFCARVAQVAELFGPPDQTKAEHWLGMYEENQTPDLIARWECGDNPADLFEIFVRAWSPKGCKIDPRSQYVKGEETEIHSECKAVLDNLLELPEAVTDA